MIWPLPPPRASSSTASTPGSTWPTVRLYLCYIIFYSFFILFYPIFHYYFLFNLSHMSSSIIYNGPHFKCASVFLALPSRLQSPINSLCLLKRFWSLGFRIRSFCAWSSAHFCRMGLLRCRSAGFSLSILSLSILGQCPKPSNPVLKKIW